MTGSYGGARIVDDHPVADDLDALYTQALDAAGDVSAALRLALDLSATAPRPGLGGTVRLWEILATLGAADLTVARCVEPHLDALAILGELGAAEGIDVLAVEATSTWGVFAAEARGMRLTAAEADGRWTLTGTKPWCSLASHLTHALVTAHVEGGGRRLFAVGLRGAGVTVQPDRWAARGLTAVRSGPVDFVGVPAVPVGAEGWYLARPGFSWGGIGVAAVWWGGALGVARRTEEWARVVAADNRDRGLAADSVATMHLGVTDLELEIARLALDRAAAVIDAPAGAVVDGTAAVLPPEAGGHDGSGAGGEQAGIRLEARILAQRTRSIVARSTEEILRTSKHAMGPAPLALEEDHARRVADLELYLRQDHAEADAAALGRALLESQGARW